MGRSLCRVLHGCSGLVAGRAMRGLERQARGGLRPVSLRKILSDGCAGGPLCFFEKDAPGRSGRRVVIADLLQPTHDRLAFDRQLEQGAEVAPKPVRGDQRLDVLRVEAQIERDASPAVVLLDASVVSAVQSGRAVPVLQAEGPGFESLCFHQKIRELRINFVTLFIFPAHNLHTNRPFDLTDGHR